MISVYRISRNNHSHKDRLIRNKQVYQVLFGVSSHSLSLFRIFDLFIILALRKNINQIKKKLNSFFFIRDFVYFHLSPYYLMNTIALVNLSQNPPKNDYYFHHSLHVIEKILGTKLTIGEGFWSHVE